MDHSQLGESGKHHGKAAVFGGVQQVFRGAQSGFTPPADVLQYPSDADTTRLNGYAKRQIATANAMASSGDKLSRPAPKLSVVTILVAMIQCIVFGGILVLGGLIENHAAMFNKSPSDIAVLYSALLCIFFGMSPMLYLMDLVYNQCRKPPGTEIVHLPVGAVLPHGKTLSFGCVCLFVGRLCGIFATDNFDSFAGTWVTFVGVGAGLIYWTTFNHFFIVLANQEKSTLQPQSILYYFQIWCGQASKRESDRKGCCTVNLTPSLTMYLSIMPFVGAFFYSLLMYYIEQYVHSDLETWKMTAMFQFVLDLFAIVLCGILYKEYQITLLREEVRLEYQIKSKPVQGSHIVNRTLLCILSVSSIALFQIAFYAPFTWFIPAAETKFNISRSDGSADLLITATAGGGVFFRALILLLTCIHPKIVDLAALLTILGVMICLFTWSSVRNMQDMRLWAIFYGGFSGATFSNFFVYCLTSVGRMTRTLDVYLKIRVFSTILGLGMSLGSALSIVTIKMTDGNYDYSITISAFCTMGSLIGVILTMLISYASGPSASVAVIPKVVPQGSQSEMNFNEQHRLLNQRSPSDRDQPRFEDLTDSGFM